MGKRLFVGNLSFDVNENELRDLFAQSGTVADCKLVTDRETRSVHLNHREAVRQPHDDKSSKCRQVSNEF